MDILYSNTWVIQAAHHWAQVYSCYYNRPYTVTVPADIRRVPPVGSSIPGGNQWHHSEDGIRNVHVSRGWSWVHDTVGWGRYAMNNQVICTTHPNIMCTCQLHMNYHPRFRLVFFMAYIAHSVWSVHLFLQYKRHWIGEKCSLNATYCMSFKWISTCIVAVTIICTAVLPQCGWTGGYRAVSTVLSIGIGIGGSGAWPPAG